jgi:hypothetical protein
MGACKSTKSVSEAGEDIVPQGAADAFDFAASIPNPEAFIFDKEHGAKEEQLKWMNYMLRVMWKHIKQAMIKKVNDKFHEKIGEELAKHPEIKLDKLTLDFSPGNKPPVLSGLLVYQRTQQERNGIQVDVDFSWQPDQEFHVRMSMHGHARAIPIAADGVGLSGMEVNGTVSCLMAPLLDVEPCVGTGQMFFLDTPQLKLKVIGMKKLGAIGILLTKVMEGVVKNILADGYILPNRFVQKVRKDLPLETMVTMKSPLPLGLLQFEVLEAKNLPASDTSLTGAKSSDPYVEIKVGHGKVRTSTIENNLNPKWSDPPGHLFVYNVAQLVRISVYDDDVMGTDCLGTVVGFNVFLLCKEQEKAGDAMWLNLVDSEGNAAGMLKIKVRYYDVADLGALPEIPKSEGPGIPPFLLSVKLLGLEAEDRGDLRATRATVEIIHPKKEEEKDNKEEHHANRLMAGLESAMQWVTTKVKAATGLGFGHREEGVPMKRRSCKAQLWGSKTLVEDQDHHLIPPMAIRAMEKLHIREKWPLKKVADMFQLDSDVVRTAVAMRGNFEVVWHEALHFLQPATDPFLGKVKISIQAPSSNQVRGADDRGFIGEFELDLSANAPEATLEGNTSFKRRIRHTLHRPRTKAEKTETPATPADSSDAKKSEGNSGEADQGSEKSEMENTGILIELLVEIRGLQSQACELDKGQTLRSREQLEMATKNTGVQIIPE